MQSAQSLAAPTWRHRLRTRLENAASVLWELRWKIARRLAALLALRLLAMACEYLPEWAQLPCGWIGHLLEALQ